MRVLVTEKQVTDFFSFCGKIQNLHLEPDGGTSLPDQPILESLQRTV